jgi:hypothetical protein
MTTKKAYAAKSIIRPSMQTKAGNAMREALPPATVEPTGAKGRGAGRAVQVVMPADTLRALRQSATEADTTVRVVILQALAKAGYPVPADELKDRRRG